MCPDSLSDFDAFKKSFLQLNHKGIVDLLDTARLEQFVQEAEDNLSGPPRNRLWTQTSTLQCFIRQALVTGSCADAVKWMQAGQLKAGEVLCSSSTSAYCQARERMSEELPWSLMRYAGGQLEEASRQYWSWRGRAVKLIDGSTLTMSDTPANQSAYPQEWNQKEGLGFPIMRIVIIASLNSGAVLDAALGPYTGKGTGETALFRQLVAGNFQRGDLCLMDRYYESYWTAVRLMTQGIDLLCPIRGNRKIDWSQGTPLHGDSYDRLLTLDKPARPHWMSVEEYKALPKQITVRVFKLYGRCYLTTLLDDRKYRKSALRRLYQQRWQVEIDLRFIKRVMALEPLRCKTPAMVRKELAVTLLAYNLIRLLMLQAAIKHRIWPRYLSFKGALGAYQAFANMLLGAAIRTLRSLASNVLKIIASSIIGQRSGRLEPRAWKRRHTKRYPYLNKLRKLAIQEILQNRHLSQHINPQYEMNNPLS